MNHIYIVKSVAGNYEQVEWSLCAVTTEEKAAALVEQFVEFNEFDCSFNERMHKEFTLVWITDHPQPQAPTKPKVPEGYHELQRVLSAKDPTKDFFDIKKLYSEFQNQHHANLNLFEIANQEYHSVRDKYLESKALARKEWFEKNYIVPSHLKEVADIADKENHPSDSSNEYSYYKLGVIH